MDNNFDAIIFKKKSFSNLLEEIYNNSKSKEKQITDLIEQLKPLIKNNGDALMLVPLIKEYLDVGIKNDEHLIKMAAIVERANKNSSTNNENDFYLSEEEKQQLLEEVKAVGQLNVSQNKINSPINVKTT